MYLRKVNQDHTSEALDTHICEVALAVVKMF